MSIDMTPTAIYQCIKSFLHTSTVPGSKGRARSFDEGKEYFYASAFDVVYLHRVDNPSVKLPQFTQKEFDALVGTHFKDTGKRPVKKEQNSYNEAV
tara:strand:- start:550 stop:837 length:288 start_codon:yes stop_codon:yes gene_type:complete